jgi:flavin reductase (DIM6/NTAB) family NADH-FMN oxidoreductase RutF
MTDELAVQDVMEEMAYGLYIVGSHKDGEPDGMMADWVMQVSFKPRLVAVGLENDSRTLENVRSTGVFSINVLSQDERSMALAAKFAQPYYDAKVGGRTATKVAVHEKLDGIAFTRSDSGCPLLEHAMAWLDCQVSELVPTGDHTLVIGTVKDGAVRVAGEPLTSTYTGWNYSG